MCGIVGYVGKSNAQDIVVSGLEKLEYRGYDSAGIAIYQDNEIKVTRAQGKLRELKKELLNNKSNSISNIGIGHTRWATHGKPSTENAHPHSAGRVSLIHNGIIENYAELKEDLISKGCDFKSETDTEIAAHLVDYFLKEGNSALEALKNTCSKIRGSYAFLFIDSENPNEILLAKNASPVIVGKGEGENFIASDIPAILDYTRNIYIMEDGDFAVINSEGIYFENNNQEVKKEVEYITWDPVTAQKGGYKHYMLKEVHEQSRAISDTIRGRTTSDKKQIDLDELGLTKEQACGTAYYSGLIAKFYIEDFAGIPCEVDYASELRYRKNIIDQETLLIAISQSGETADTLAAVEIAGKNARKLAICNVLGSSISRKVDHVLYTHAGPEISVASTKAFATQLASVYMLSIYLGQLNGKLDQKRTESLVNNLLHLPEEIEKIAKKYYNVQDFLFIGRGICFPIALEGALKLKEISYIHAEGYPAGELKHGPIALIDEQMPVVVVLQKSDTLFEKTLSNLREVESRGAKIIAITDIPDHPELSKITNDMIVVPHLTEELSPILTVIPMQLLAYNVAVLNGTDVDLPRNLAKSVTVE
ncbi:UNVERIFIED_CONTAM: hypothetical protein GTU68_009822 [Idotea baltica]|nr:hypothetical protein [Idotea baltica]